MGLEVALDALTDDAAIWEDASGTLEDAASAAGGLGLTHGQFSFAGGTVAATYEELRSRVQTLLEDGAGKLDDGAAQLRQVRTTYEGSDEASKDSLDGVWDWD